MSRLLLLTVLAVAGCSGDGTGSKPTPVRYSIYVDGTNTGTPGPYCSVSMSTPAFLSLTSQPQVLDSVVAQLTVKAGRYPVSWSVDYFNSSGGYNGTISSGFNDSTDVPGGMYFYC